MPGVAFLLGCIDTWRTMSSNSQELQPAGTDSSPAPMPELEDLSPRLRRAVLNELCPGECLERVSQPGALRRTEAVLRQLATLAAGAAGLTLIGLWISGRGWAVFVIVALLALMKQRSPCVYVLTDQRCFTISPTGFGFRVEDLDETPIDDRLAPGDLAEIARRIAGFKSRLRAGTLGSGLGSARIARDLPADVAATVRATLHPGETLRWVDRPGARQYFLHTPLDVLTSAGFFGVAALIAAAGVSHGSGLTGTAFQWAVGAGGLLVLSLLRMRRQMRGTAYAITDRRGFVLVPGRAVASYPLSEMRTFRRTQDAAGKGTLAPLNGKPVEGFYGVRNVKVIDDLIKNRAPHDRSTEMVPAGSQPGLGSEILAPAPVAGVLTEETEGQQ